MTGTKPAIAAVLGRLSDGVEERACRLANAMRTAGGSFSSGWAGMNFEASTGVSVRARKMAPPIANA